VTKLLHTAKVASKALEVIHLDLKGILYNNAFPACKACAAGMPKKHGSRLRVKLCAQECKKWVIERV